MTEAPRTVPAATPAPDLVALPDLATLPDLAARAALAELARAIAVEAAELAGGMRAEGVEVAATKSSPIDIVTRADRASEALIRERLRAARPDDGFLGEESGADRGVSGLTWVVDPIDGTVNYLYGLPNWAVSIAVVAGEPDPASWRPLAGAVVAPVLGETFVAWAGGGAWRGEHRMHVRPPVALDLALIATGFHYTAPVRARQTRVVAGVLPRVRDLRRAGSAAIDLAQVAAGTVDGMYEEGLNPWDHAAGALLVREAGGVVTGLAGDPATVRMLIAGGPEVAAELDALLVTLDA